MSQLHDMLAVAKGARKILEAAAKLKSERARTLIENSSWIHSAGEVCAASRKTFASENLQPKEIFERLHVVSVGVQKYISPQKTVSSESPLPKTDLDELNTKFESIFDISNFEKYMTPGTNRELATEKNERRYKSSFIKTTAISPELNAASTSVELPSYRIDPEAESIKTISSISANVQLPGDLPFEGKPSEKTVVYEDNKFNEIRRDDNFPSRDVTVSINPLLNSLGNERSLRPETSKPKPKRKQTLSETSRQRAVPSSRIGRMFAFGSLAAGLGIGTATEYAKSALLGSAKKESESIGDSFLSAANAERIVDTLCKVRGAALKLGQLLSLQDESIVSPELQKIFERVRQSADFMPARQIESVMSSELGPEWRNEFERFEDKPFAAASIGQVHLAVLHDGTEVAVKIQYPGVAKGINSDIDNLVSVLNVWNIFPKGLFIDNIVEVAKKELAWEVDYAREADRTKKFKRLLEDHPEYYVPAVIDSLSADRVLTTELIEGLPLDKCFDMDEAVRENIAHRVMNLCLLEMFVFRCMQTDPNWSNFFYNSSTDQLILLDFGATREYSKEFMDKYIRIIKAASDADSEKVLTMSKEMKFLTGYETKAMERAHVDTVMIMAEVFNPQKGHKFDFSSQSTTRRLQKLVPTILTYRLCPPPEEIYSMHRKLSGVFLLCSKLKVRMDCRNMFQSIYDQYEFSDNSR